MQSDLSEILLQMLIDENASIRFFFMMHKKRHEGSQALPVESDLKNCFFRQLRKVTCVRAE